MCGRLHNCVHSFLWARSEICLRLCTWAFAACAGVCMHVSVCVCVNVRGLMLPRCAVAQVRSWTHELAPLASLRVCTRVAVLALASHGVSFVAGTADRRIVTAPIPLSSAVDEPGTLFHHHACCRSERNALASCHGGLGRVAAAAPVAWVDGFEHTPVAVAALPGGDYFVGACAPEVRISCRRGCCVGVLTSSVCWLVQPAAVLWDAAGIARAFSTSRCSHAYVWGG